jgi:hypothetical protein
MPPAGATVFIDTNAIGAAHRHGCWNALRKYYRLCTVGTCLEEATRPDRHGRTLTDKELDQLSTEVSCVPVSKSQEAALMMALQGKPSLDPGEKELLAAAYALGATAAWVLCGPDKAALLALHRLKLARRMISLEELASAAGQRVTNLEAQYGSKWLGQKRTQLGAGRRVHLMNSKPERSKRSGCRYDNLKNTVPEHT